MGMTVALLIISLFLISLVGIDFFYDSDSGELGLSIRVFGIKIRVLGGDKKKKTRKKSKKEAETQEQKKDETKPPKERQKRDKELVELIIKNSIEVLRRIKRKITFELLVLHIRAASPDAASAALMYGRANAVIGTLFPVMDSSLRVRERDIQTTLDFSTDRPAVYVRMEIVFQIWELFYVVGKFAVEFLNYKYRVR